MSSARRGWLLPSHRYLPRSQHTLNPTIRVLLSEAAAGRGNHLALCTIIRNGVLCAKSLIGAQKAESGHVDAGGQAIKI